MLTPFPIGMTLLLRCVYGFSLNSVKINNSPQAVKNILLDKLMPGINQELNFLHENNRSSYNAKPSICVIYQPP